MVFNNINDNIVEKEWTNQFGTSGHDGSDSVAVSSDGSVYVAGYTYGDLGGTNEGESDGFLRKYNSKGKELWTKQLGTSSQDATSSVAVSGDGNSVYVTGYTGKDLVEGTNAGNYDAFLRKYDSEGEVEWTKQFGTTGFDSTYSVAVSSDGNSVYVTGEIMGNLGEGGPYAFLRKYNSEGEVGWIKQFGTSSEDVSNSVAVSGDGNSVYVTGYTNGNLKGTNEGEADAFLRKYDSEGEVEWTKQFGTTGIDGSNSVAVSSDGSVYVTGSTNGNLGGTNAGMNDAFLRKYDSYGEVEWTKQFGTTGIDDSFNVAVSGDGNSVYVTGYTMGNLGDTNEGGTDVFLRKYNSDGEVGWTKQFGTDGDDYSNSVAVSSDGKSVYVTGSTMGNLGDTNAGNKDVFLRKYTIYDGLTGSSKISDKKNSFLLSVALKHMKGITDITDLPKIANSILKLL